LQIQEAMEVICFSGSDGQEPSDIHMLIGADFFWHIVSGNVKRGEHGHIAMETKLGYVLSGPETTPDTGDDTGGGGGEKVFSSSDFTEKIVRISDLANNSHGFSDFINTADSEFI
jgi:hypothetical protein